MTTERGSHAAPPLPSPQQHPYYDDTVRSKTLTLVVWLSLSLFTLTTQGITTGTSSDLTRKVWVTAYAGDTY